MGPGVGCCGHCWYAALGISATLCQTWEASYQSASRTLGELKLVRHQAYHVRRYARKHIGKEMSLRLTPEIRFVFDDSIERSERVRAVPTLGA